MNLQDEIRELHIAYLWAQFIAANERKRAELSVAKQITKRDSFNERTFK